MAVDSYSFTKTMLRRHLWINAKQIARSRATLFERNTIVRRFASQRYTSDAQEFCFDARNRHRLVTPSDLQLEDRITDAILSPSLQTVDQTQSLIQRLPDDLAHSLAQCENVDALTEIVLDIGRKPFAWIAGERHFIGDLNVTAEQIQQISGSLRFGSDNRQAICRRHHYHLPFVIADPVE